MNPKKVEDQGTSTSSGMKTLEEGEENHKVTSSVTPGTHEGYFCYKSKLF